MTCQDCIHFDVCGYHITEMTPMTVNECSHFKPKSRFVELPCEVGSKIYMLVTRKTNSFEWDENKRMLKVTNQHTFIKDTYFTKLNFWRVIDDFGKTVFLSKEEAEKALKERESK